MNFKKSNDCDLTKFKYYYENICVSFASLRLFNPNSSLVLFTTKDVPEIYLQKLIKLNVKIRILKVEFIPIRKESNKFLGSLFLLDCIKNQQVNTLYLDPDVICLSSLEYLNLSEDTIVVYDAQHFAENKITIQKISKILEGDSLSTFKTFKYCGGEFFFIPQSRVDEITFNIEKIWKRNESSDFSSGEYFQTEEHFLSLAIHNLHSVETTNSISRLWTTRTYRKIPKNYRELLLIHLPAEKDNGISKLFSILFEDHESTNLEIFTTGGRKRLYRILNISQSIFGALQFQFSRFLKSLLRMIRF